MSALTPHQLAFLDAYVAACAEVPQDLRRFVILIGGAASIAHGMPDRKTQDTDILVSAESLVFLEDAIVNLRGGFHRDTDGVIKWNKSDTDGNYQFEVEIEIIQIGGPFVPRVPDVVKYRNGFVAKLPELVRLRASTLVARGDKQDYYDFEQLLLMTNQRGLKLPKIGEEELELLVEAVEMLKARDADVLFMNILGEFELGEGTWSCWQDYEHYYQTNMQ